MTEKTAILLINLGSPEQLTIKSIRTQCQATFQSFIRELALTEGPSCLVFQSKSEKARRLEPYCDETLKKSAKKHHSIGIICPGLPVDCLETLYEMNIENREIFLNAGGENFHHTPALNTRDSHTHALSKIIDTSPESENDQP